MWVIYDQETLDILARHYTKVSAKTELKKYWYKRLRAYGIDKVDLCRIEEWKTWKALTKVHR